MPKRNTNTPYIYLCTGMSLDGKISTSKRVDTRISTDDDRNFLYDLRVPCDAIMMGGRTIALDDPGLTVKSAGRQKQRLALGKTKEPIKIAVISDVAGIKLNGDFINKGEAGKIIFTTERSSKNNIKKFKRVANVFVYGKHRVNLKKAAAKLCDLGIKSVMVEGGGELIYSLFEDNLVDEINLKIGDLILGGRMAPTLCDGDGFDALTAKPVKLIGLKKKNGVLMLKYKVRK